MGEEETKPVGTNTEVLTGKDRSRANLVAPWKPGQVTNPTGRPKNPWPAFMRAVLKGADGTTMTRGEMLMQTMFAEAVGIRHCKDPSKNRELILQHWLGKPMQSVQLSGSDDAPPVRVNLAFLDVGQLEKLNAAMVEASLAAASDGEPSEPNAA